MDQIRQLLAQASTFFREGNKKNAYYKYIDAAFSALDLLGAEAVFVFGREEIADKHIASHLFAICIQSLDRSKECLEAVLDLNEDEADIASQSGILLSSVQAVSPDGDVDPIKPAVRSDLARNPWNDSRSEVASTQSTTTSDDTLLISKLALPLIPISQLALNHCSQTYKLQLLYQRLQKFREASPKARGNGLYLGSISSLASQIIEEWRIKRGYEVQIKKSRRLKLREIQPLDLARQLTLLQFNIWVRIRPEELESCSWDSEEAYYKAPRVRALLDLGNYISQWCEYEVLRPTIDSDRASTMAHLIKLAMALQELGNFEGVKCIVRGLNAASIQRMRRTVHLIPRRLRQQLESLELLTSERRNYAQLREALAKADPKMSLPYLRMYLTELQLAQGDPSLGPACSHPDLAVLEQVRDLLLKTQKSVYVETISADLTLQHYVLTRPFRWAEELYSLSESREPPSQLRREIEADGSPLKAPPTTPERMAPLSTDELRALAEQDSDRYDIYFRQLSAMRSRQPDANTSSYSLHTNFIR